MGENSFSFEYKFKKETSTFKEVGWSYPHFVMSPFTISFFKYTLDYYLYLVNYDIFLLRCLLPVDSEIGIHKWTLLPNQETCQIFNKYLIERFLVYKTKLAISCQKIIVNIDNGLKSG